MDLFSVKTSEDVDLLILAGHDINFRNENWYTPLHNACINGYLDVVKKLCSLGANIHAVNHALNKPIDKAAEHGYLEIVKFFVENYGVISNRLLCNSLVNESIDVFDYVLTLSPNLDEKVYINFIYRTALIMACQKKSIYCVDKLLCAGANVNIISLCNESPLLYICNNQIITEQAKGIIQRLLFFGADINQQRIYDNHIGFGSLHYICHFPNMLDIVKLLISQNANVNLLTSKNETPLIIACLNNNYEYIPCLLEAGADVDIDDYNGNNALDLCSNKEMQKLIIKYSKKKRTIVMINGSYLFL